MTDADLQQIIDAAGRATPGPWHEWITSEYIANCDPQTAAALARIAHAAVEVSRLKAAMSSAATKGTEAFVNAAIALGKAETTLNDALRDAGLIP